MDVELREIIACFDLGADFFITSHSIKKLWQKCFQPQQYKVPLENFL